MDFALGHKWKRRSQLNPKVQQKDLLRAIVNSEHRENRSRKRAARERRNSAGSDRLFSIEVAIPDVKTYLRLREKAGMRPRTISGATKGLGSELFSVLLRHDESDQIVGMGRVVGDGGTVFHI